MCRLSPASFSPPVQYLPSLTRHLCAIMLATINTAKITQCAENGSHGGELAVPRETQVFIPGLFHLLVTPARGILCLHLQLTSRLLCFHPLMRTIVAFLNRRRKPQFYLNRTFFVYPLRPPLFPAFLSFLWVLFKMSSHFFDPFHYLSPHGNSSHRISGTD